MDSVEGSCLCGDVAWEATGPFELMTHCHCSICRKSHGAAFATYVAVPADGFRWLRGEDAIRRFESSPGFWRPFCGQCGSVVAGEPGAGRVFMPAGCLDGDPGVEPLAHIFVASKAPWYEIPGELRRFDCYPRGAGEEVTGPDPEKPRGGVVAGSCLCGSVAYELDGKLELIVNCHCSRCRKGRAVAHATNLLVPAANLRWIRGEDLVKSYKVPEAERFQNSFCATCGSLMPRVWESGGTAIVPAGTLDGDPGARPRLHIYVGSKAPWFAIADDLPRFDESPRSV